MTLFILRRLLQAVPVLVGISIVTWGLMELAPGDAAELYARQFAASERPREVVGAFHAEEFIAAAERGHDVVALSAQGIALDFSTVRFRQDLLRPVSARALDAIAAWTARTLATGVNSHGGER